MADGTRIARIPSANDVSQPGSLRPSGNIAVADMSGIAEGAAALGVGIERLGAGVDQRDRVIKSRERTSDVAAADAAWLTGEIDLRKRVSGDADYSGYGSKYTPETTTLRDNAAKSIRDPVTRQEWLDHTELKRIALAGDIDQHATDLSHAADRTRLGDNVTSLAKLISDPSLPDVVRNNARAQIEGMIGIARGSGLIAADEASKLRKAGLEDATNALAVNKAELGIEFGDPRQVLKDMAIPKWNSAHAPVADWAKSLSFDQRLAIAEKARSKTDEQDVNVRASLEVIKDNAPAAIAATGIYDKPLPTSEDFNRAYGAVNGPQQFDAFNSAIDTARSIHGFRTMDQEDILATVEAATPTSTGNKAAAESQKFETLSNAAQSTLDARTKDPAGYVMSAFPDVQKAFEAASNDPAQFANALTLMKTAQEHLGIERPMLLPKAMAADAVATFTDTTKPASERVGAVAGLLLRTQDEAQQAMIFDQLIDAKLPAYTRGAVAAMMRGDSGGATNLMRAVMIDPKDMAIDKPGGVDASQISSAIAGIFDDGEIGDVVYGVTDGSTDNFQRVVEDSTLLERDVRLHLIDGTAGGNLNKAIELTTKDMYGDVQLVTGQGAKLTLPKGEDPAPIRGGLQQLEVQVSGQLRSALLAGVDEQFPSATGMRALVEAGIDNYVSQVMDQGYFVNAGEDKFQYLNPFTGAVIGDNSNQPLTFTKAEVLAQAPPINQAMPPSNRNITPQQLQKIYGGNFNRPANTGYGKF